MHNSNLFQNGSNPQGNLNLTNYAQFLSGQITTGHPTQSINIANVLQNKSTIPLKLDQLEPFKTQNIALNKNHLLTTINNANQQPNLLAMQQHISNQLTATNFSNFPVIGGQPGVTPVNIGRDF